MLLNLLLNARLQERDAKVRFPPFALSPPLSLSLCGLILTTRMSLNSC